MYRFCAHLLTLRRVIFEKQPKMAKKYVENAHFCHLLRDKSKGEHETPLPYALLTPTLKTNLDSMIKCPLYANTNRTSIKKSSSFLCYIPVQSDIVEHLVFKKGIMLAIDDQNRN